MIVGLFALGGISRVVRKKTLALRTVLIFFGGLLLCTYSIYALTWRWLHPLGIRYEFECGATGSWQAVQFYHQYDGREIKGPWVGGYPLKVRFPDLNHDGYPDIRVIGSLGEIVEYAYLPKNDGHCFWQWVKNNENHRGCYPPDGLPTWP